MVSLEDSVIARFETGGNRFEILVDPKAAQEYNAVSYTHLTLPTIYSV